tara:strand:- start:244 stop:375 length:132 start_codon:yes stop_codon:yes gene_type:complete
MLKVVTIEEPDGKPSQTMTRMEEWFTAVSDTIKKEDQNSDDKD